MDHFTDTFSVGFYCRPSRKSPKGGSPVQMGINLQGERFFISLPRKADPKQFKKMMVSQRQDDLSALEEMGLLTKVKIGKEYIWFNTELMDILSD